MKEVYGNAWELEKDYDFFCITSNGITNKDGDAVMGRGIAAQFKTRYPFAPSILGKKIKLNGNVVQPIMWNDKICFIAFPVKHHWRDAADLQLIRKSAFELSKKAIAMPDKLFLLPKPGCGNGRLTWEDVKRVIEDLLPDNVHIVDFSPGT